MTDSVSRSASTASSVRELIGAEVLVIDQDETVRKGMTELLSTARLHVSCEQDPDIAVARVQKQFFSVVIIDIDTPRARAGLETARRVLDRSPTSVVVMLTPRKSFDDALDAIRAGAIDIIWKSNEAVPYLKDRVMEAASRSVDKREVNAILVDVQATHQDFLHRFMDAERRCVDLQDEVAGRDPSRGDLGDEVRVLVVDTSARVAQELAKHAGEKFLFDTVNTGGEALDRASSSHYHIALVNEQLPDLPGSMVVRSLVSQVPDTMIISYVPRGPVELIEQPDNRVLLEKFTSAPQLTEKLVEIAEHFRQKARDRRYTQAFRERHYDFLRRYVELKMKIDRSLGSD